MWTSKQICAPNFGKCGYAVVPKAAAVLNLRWGTMLYGTCYIATGLILSQKRYLHVALPNSFVVDLFDIEVENGSSES